MRINNPGGKSFLGDAGKYSAAKYLLSLADSAFSLLFLFLLARSGLSGAIGDGVRVFTSGNFLALPAYLLAVSVIYYIFSFPLNLYRTFILEHKFRLSNQKIKDWALDQLKAGIIFYLISLLLFGAFYFILGVNPRLWWAVMSAFWIFFSLILSRLMPIIIIPLFFKYKKITDESLRGRIISLARRMKVGILDVYEINFSKKTLKANAAFVGFGASKRVLLADTLAQKYSHDEIEVILAHEFAHYKLKHLLKLICINSFSTVITFYAMYKTSHSVLGWFGFSSLGDFAAMPVVLIYLLSLELVMRPLLNYYSRRMEKNADILALKATGSKDAFISMMEKLSSQNLSDTDPQPLIKFFFFDHPPSSERIALAKSYK